MRDALRLSRVNHPRATVRTMLLLATVFIFLGLLANKFTAVGAWAGQTMVVNSFLLDEPLCIDLAEWLQ